MRLARIIHQPTHARTTVRLRRTLIALEDTRGIPVGRRKACEAESLRDPQMIRAKGGVIVLLALMVGPLGGLGCLDENCSDAGCRTPIDVDMPIESAMETSVVQLCLNQDCGELGWPRGGSRCAQGKSADGARISACDDGKRASFSWATEGQTVRDGDQFSLSLMDANGRVILSHEQSIDYEEYFPNGPDCDPSPCRYFELSL